MITSIADAYLDSTPLVAITAQVMRSLIGRGAFPGNGRVRHDRPHREAQLSGDGTLRWLGMHGAVFANNAVNEADLVIAWAPGLTTA